MPQARRSRCRRETRSGDVQLKRRRLGRTSLACPFYRRPQDRHRNEVDPRAADESRFAQHAFLLETRRIVSAHRAMIMLEDDELNAIEIEVVPAEIDGQA